MSDTTFSAGTVIASDWLNDVNQHVYRNKAFINVADSAYGTLQAAYDALPNNGGCVIVPPEYTETFTSNLVLDKPFTGFLFLGSATIIMGVHKIIMNDGCPGQFIDTISGVSGGDYYAQVNQGVIFRCTGSGVAIEVGQGTLQVGSEQDCFRLLRGFGLNMESMTGNNPIGIQLNNQLRMNVEGVNVKMSGGGAGGVNGMKGLQLNAVGVGYVAWVNIRDSFFNGGMIGVETVGQCNLNTWTGGGCSTSPSAGTSWGVYRGVSGGAAFIATNIEIAGAVRAVELANGVSYDRYENYGETNTYDIYFAAGATYNIYKRLVMDGVVTLSDGNGATTTNLALQAGNDGAANLYLAGNGGQLLGKTSSGNYRSLIGHAGSNSIYYGEIVDDVLIHQFLGDSGTLGILDATGYKVTGGFACNGATIPSQTTGFGTPTGNSVISNFPGASASLPQCSATIAQILAILKANGIVGA